MHEQLGVELASSTCSRAKIGRLSVPVLLIKYPSATVSSVLLLLCEDDTAQSRQYFMRAVVFRWKKISHRRLLD